MSVALGCRPTSTQPGTLAAVRCCSFDGSLPCQSICSDRVGFNLLPPRTCIDPGRADRSEAKGECRRRGRRLCSLEELQIGLCCKTGCAMDATEVWVADEQSGAIPLTQEQVQRLAADSPAASARVNHASDCTEKRERLVDVPTRALVARALYDQARRDPQLRRIRTHVGVVGTAGPRARGVAMYGTAGYIRLLLRSKLVVTCNPNTYEGDSRLLEALASGALVLADAMRDPPPGLENGEHLLWYEDTDDMLQKVRHWTQPAAQRRADAIAERGAAYARNRSVANLIG